MIFCTNENCKYRAKRPSLVQFWPDRIIYKCKAGDRWNNYKHLVLTTGDPDVSPKSLVCMNFEPNEDLEV